MVWWWGLSERLVVHSERYSVRWSVSASGTSASAKDSPSVDMLVRLSFTPEVLLAYSAVQAGSLPMVQLEVPPHVRSMAAFEAHMRQKVRFQVKKGIVFLDGDFEVPKEATRRQAPWR